MAKKKKYRVYKKGGESFKPHTMYNPKTGKGYLATEYADHLEMQNMGYSHEPVMVHGGMPCYECGGHIKYQDGAAVTYGTPAYNQAYQQGTVTRYNPETDVYQAPDLPEFTVKPSMSFMDEMDYIGNTAMNFLGELSGVNPAIRIMNDPMGTLKGTGQTIADVAMYSNPGSAMYAQFSDRNPMTGQPYWEGVDQAMDVLSVAPAIGIGGKTAKLAKPAMKGLKSTMKKGIRKMDPYSRLDDLTEEVRKEGLDWYRELATEEAEKVAKFKSMVDQETAKATFGKQPMLTRRSFGMTKGEQKLSDVLSTLPEEQVKDFVTATGEELTSKLKQHGISRKDFNNYLKNTDDYYKKQAFLFGQAQEANPRQWMKERLMSGSGNPGRLPTDYLTKYGPNPNALLNYMDPDVIRNAMMWESQGLPFPTHIGFFSHPSKFTGAQAMQKISPNKYGGPMKYKSGGSSKAPQNVNTGDIGRTRIDLMKNHLAENTYKNLLQQRDEIVANMMMTQPMYQYGSSVGKGMYNPNRQFGAMYAQAHADAKKNLLSSAKTFGNEVKKLNYRQQKQKEAEAAKERLAYERSQVTNNPFTVTNDLSTVPSNFNEQYTSPAYMQFMTPMQSPGGSFAYGGNYLPKAQDGTNTRANVPLPQPYNPYAVQPGYEPLNEQEKRWIDAEMKKMQMQGSEWYNPKFTGFWDAVTSSKGQNEFKPRSVVMNMLGPDIAISDPRRHRAIQNIIPGYGGGAERSIMSSIGDVFFMPQKMLNEAFTGYYEFPSETYKRYVKPEEQSELAKVALDIASDPLIVLGPSEIAKTATSIPKGVVTAGKEIAETAELAGKYGKKAAQYTAKKAEEAYKAAEEIVKKYGPEVMKFFKNIPYKDIAKLYEKYGSRLGQVIMKQYEEDTSPYSQEAMQGQPSYQSLIQTQTMPASSTQVAATPPVPPVGMPDLSNLTDEELNAILQRGYKYGGNLPKARDGVSTPGVGTVLDNRRFIAAQNLREARERANELINPFYGIPQLAQNSVYQFGNRYVPEQTVAESVAKTATEKAKAKTKGKDKGTTAAEVTEQAVEDAKKKGTVTTEEEVIKGNTDEKVTGDTDTYTDTESVRTTGGYFPPYAGGRFKLKGSIKEYDPVTGKMTKKTRIQPLKYNTAYGPRDYFGRRGPRVVKIPINQTYNINPFRMDLTPGSESFNALYNTSGSSSAAGLTPEQIAGREAEAEYAAEQAEIRDYDAMMDQYYEQSLPVDRVRPRGMQVRETTPSLAIPERGYQLDPILFENAPLYTAGDYRKAEYLPYGDINVPKSRKHYYKFEYGGMPQYQFNSQTFDLNTYQPGQFTDGFGPKEGGFGPMTEGFQAWETGDSPYMNTFKETDLEAKYKGRSNIGQYMPLIGAGVDVVSSGLEYRQMQPPNTFYQAMANAPLWGAGDASRGSIGVNTGEMFAQMKVPVQFQGNNFGMAGNPYFPTSRYGGDMPKAQGGLNFTIDPNSPVKPDTTGPNWYVPSPSINTGPGMDYMDYMNIAPMQLDSNTAPMPVNPRPITPSRINSLRDTTQQFVPNPAGMMGAPGMLQTGGSAYQEGNDYYLSEDEINAIISAGGEVEYL